MVDVLKLNLLLNDVEKIKARVTDVAPAIVNYHFIMSPFFK